MADKEAELKRMVISALHQGLLAKGVHEVCKAIEAHQAKFCVLAEDCTEGKNKIILDSYKKLVKALCKEHQIPLTTVKQGATLGQYIGLCKYDSSNNIRKTKKCSSVVLKEFPADVTEEDAKAFLDSLK